MLEDLWTRSFLAGGSDVEGPSHGDRGRQILHTWISFFWGFIKTEVYKRPVENLNILKRRIRAAVRMVNNDMLANTWMELMSRLQLLRDNGGRHIEVY